MPTFDDLSPATSMTADRTWEAFQSKYVTAGNYAVWAQGLLEGNLKEIRDKLEQDDITPALTDLLALIEAIPTYTPGTIMGFVAPTTPDYKEVPDYTAPTMGTLVTVPDYVAPTSPTLLTIPSYDAPTLGSMLSIPTLDPIVIPDAPSSDVTFTNSEFTDTLLTSVKSKLTTDLGTNSTGLGSAETALFARETARQNAARAAAYTELTTQYSARGWDMPPGALLAKQTEVNNQSALLLSDSSSQIMAESARLAVDYNKHVLSVIVQLEDLLGRLHDSKVARDFEAAKVTVQLAFEGFKAVVEAALTEANIQKAAVEAVVANNKGVVEVFLGQLQGEIDPIKAIAGVNQSLVQAFTSEVDAAIAPVKAAVDVNDGIIKAFLGEVEGQTAPMKAIADVNQSSSAAYASGVQAASAAVQADALPEELKIKQTQLQLEDAKVKASVLSDTAKMAIEAAFRDTSMSVETLKAVALQCAQMIAASFNTVSASSSIAYQAQGSTKYDGDITTHDATTRYVADLKIQPPSYT